MYIYKFYGGVPVILDKELKWYPTTYLLSATEDDVKFYIPQFAIKKSINEIFSIIKILNWPPNRDEWLYVLTAPYPIK